MSTDLSSLVPPQNRDAERAVLGAVLRDPDVLPDVLAIVGPEAMYFDPHRRVLSAIVRVSGREEPVDLVTVYQELRRTKGHDDAGGSQYLAELFEAVPTGANAVHHAKLVRDAAALRAFIHLSNSFLRDAYSPTMPVEELLGQAERQLYALNTDASAGTGEPRSLAEAVRESLAAIDKRIETGDALSGLSTGFASLDEYTGGMRPGELIIIGARPSVGKTALALNLANLITRTGTGVLFFSMEMPTSEITDRMLAMTSGVPMHRMGRPRELNTSDLDALFDAATSTLSERPLYIEDTPDRTAAQVANVARRACRRHNVKLIIVDYLQLMRPENPKDNRTQQVGALALRMKQMARNLGVPVILLSQLNRESENANRPPRLADLRESGDIEAHADRVFLLHREPNLPVSDPIWPIEVIIAKNRNGPTGEMRLAYRRPVLRFENAVA